MRTPRRGARSRRTRAPTAARWRSRSRRRAVDACRGRSRRPAGAGPSLRERVSRTRRRRSTTCFRIVRALPDYDAFGALLRAGKPVTTAAMLDEAGRMASVGAAVGRNALRLLQSLPRHRGTGRRARHRQALRAGAAPAALLPARHRHAFIRPARWPRCPPIARRLPLPRRTSRALRRGGLRRLLRRQQPVRVGARLRRFARAFAMPAKRPGAAVPGTALWPLRAAGRPRLRPHARQLVLRDRRRALLLHRRPSRLLQRDVLRPREAARRRPREQLGDRALAAAADHTRARGRRRRTQSGAAGRAEARRR